MHLGSPAPYAPSCQAMLQDLGRHKGQLLINIGRESQMKGKSGSPRGQIGGCCYRWIILRREMGPFGGRVRVYMQRNKFQGLYCSLLLLTAEDPGPRSPSSPISSGPCTVLVISIFNMSFKTGSFPPIRSVSAINPHLRLPSSSFHCPASRFPYLLSMGIVLPFLHRISSWQKPRCPCF